MSQRRMLNPRIRKCAVLQSMLLEPELTGPPVELPTARIFEASQQRHTRHAQEHIHRTDDSIRSRVEPTCIGWRPQVDVTTGHPERKLSRIVVSEAGMTPDILRAI